MSSRMTWLPRGRIVSQDLEARLSLVPAVLLPAPTPLLTVCFYFFTLMFTHPTPQSHWQSNKIIWKCCLCPGFWRGNGINRSSNVKKQNKKKSKLIKVKLMTCITQRDCREGIILLVTLKNNVYNVFVLLNIKNNKLKSTPTKMSGIFSSVMTLLFFFL